MSILQHEISTLTHTSPGDSGEPQWDNFTEVAFKDIGSLRAAQVAVSACGELVAMRSARKRVTVAGGRFRPNGKDMASNIAIEDAQLRVAQVRGLLRGFEKTVGDGNKGNELVLGRQGAALMLAAMEELPTLNLSGQYDETKYYAAVIPDLLEKTVISVSDEGKFRYEI